MNKQELTSIIRTIVREEVERSLPNVLVEILASKVTEGQSVVTERAVSTQQKRTLPVARPQQKFSTNPILNKILNETHGGVPQEEGSAMVSQEMPVPGAQVSILDKMKNVSKQQLTENKEVAGVINVLNRDFRQLVRAIDKKSGNVPAPNFKMSPGMFDQE